MKIETLAVVWVALGLLLMPSPVIAHHGSSGYDATKMTIVKATITEFVWANPHCRVKFDTTDDQGNVTHWAIEAANVNSLTERGWNRKSLKPGDVVTIHFNAARNGSTSGILRRVVFLNGQEIS